MSEIKTGHKQTEVGVIPEDWEVDSIGNTFNIVTMQQGDSDREIEGEWLSSEQRNSLAVAYLTERIKSLFILGSYF
jgi:hypothetical protein